MASWTIRKTFTQQGLVVAEEIITVRTLGGASGKDGPSIHSGLDLDDGTNPHETTQEDVGLSNVDNTSDANKPISTAAATKNSTQDTAIGFKAAKSNVLELNNTDAFTPDADYEPATKKYVDDSSGGGAVTPLFKTVDETKNNDAARVLDTDLQAELEASSSYRFEVLLRVVGSNIRLAACEFQIPSGATGEYTTSPFGTNRVHIDLTTVTNAGNNFSNTEYCYMSGVIITTNAGTFGIKWAQDSSSAENVTLQKGSNILLTKLN